MTSRQALADAANTVAAVSVTPYFAQTTKPGSGCVRLSRLAWPNPFAAVVTWEVVVFLPQDMASAEKWLDANLSDLAEALGPEFLGGAPTSVQPSQMQIPDVGVVYAVVIEGNREQNKE